MKVLRSTLIAAAAVVAAACGDKVNVTQQTPPTPAVISVTVAPATAVLAVGATLNLTAAVSADAGATYTVAWTTSDASKVSVNATTGAISAVALTPGVAVCASAGGKSGCASIIVANNGPVPVAGTISISAVNFTNGAGQQQPAPVPPGCVGNACVGAQLNVVMNLNVGTTTADSIVLRVGGKTAYRQAFSTAQAAALRAAASGEIAGQLAGVVLITGSFSTMDYCSPALPPLGVGPTGTCPNSTPGGAAVLLGTATWQNGNQAFQALYFGKQVPAAGGAPVNSASSSPVATYRFANFDAWHLNMTMQPVTELPNPTGSPSAVQNAVSVDVAGYAWKAGAMFLKAWFIQYTPGTLPSQTAGLVNASFNNALQCTVVGLACGAPIVPCANGGTRISPMVLAAEANAAATAGPWTTTFAGPANQGGSTGTGAALANVIGVEYNVALGGGGCFNAMFTSGGEIPSIVAIGTDNNNILTFAPGFNGGGGIINTFANSNNSDQGIVVRLDNVAPPTPTFMQEAFGSTSGGCSLQGSASVTTLNGRTNCWYNDAVVLNGLGFGFNTGDASGLTASATPGTVTDGILFSGIDIGSGRQIGGAGPHMTTFSARADVATLTSAAIDGEAAITSTAGLAESGVNNLYALRERSTDPLNNTRNTGAGTFGVDRTLPALSQIGGQPNGTRTNVVAPTLDILSATDPLGTGSAGPVLGSGFFSASLQPVRLSQARRTAAGTTFFCPSTVGVGVGAYTSSGTTCFATSGINGWFSGTTNFLSNFSFCDVHNSLALCAPFQTASAAISDAYYTATATIKDQAGNTSAPLVNLELMDGSAANLGGLTYAPAIFLPGQPATFSSASVNDNLDIQGVSLNLTYGASGGAAGWGTAPFDNGTAAPFAGTTGPGGATFWYNNYNTQFPNAAASCVLLQTPYCDFPINTWPNATTAPAALIQNTTFSATLPNMITNIEVPTTTDGGPRAFFAGDNLNNANGLAFNQACSLGFAGVCTPSGLSALAIPATALPPTVLIDGTGGASPVGGPIRWTLCAISGSGLCPATIPDPALVAATFCVSEFGGTACPASVAITAAAQGLSAASAGTPNFSNPFAQVQFWAYNPTAGPTTEGWRLIGTVNAPNSTTDASGACTAVTACSGRNWMFGIVWTPTPGTAFNSAPTIYKIMAIGIMNGTSHPAAAGMSLATPVSAKTVTVFP